jgi:hypothetical protein
VGHEFKNPVQIFVGFGFPAEIKNVFDAWHVLLEVPPSMRRPSHAAALEACFDALDCGDKVDSARDAFERFARASGMLAEDAFTRASERFATEWLPV